MCDFRSSEEVIKEYNLPVSKVTIIKPGKEYPTFLGEGLYYIVASGSYYVYSDGEKDYLLGYTDRGDGEYIPSKIPIGYN